MDENQINNNGTTRASGGTPPARRYWVAIVLGAIVAFIGLLTRSASLWLGWVLIVAGMALPLIIIPIMNRNNDAKK